MKPQVGKTHAIREMEESIERDIRATEALHRAKDGHQTSATHQQQGRVSEKPRKPATQSERRARPAKTSERPRRTATTSAQSAQTGFEIGATGRAAPSIGESTFNSETSSAVELIAATLDSGIKHCRTHPSARASGPPPWAQASEIVLLVRRSGLLGRLQPARTQQPARKQ